MPLPDEDRQPTPAQVDALLARIDALLAGDDRDIVDGTVHLDRLEAGSDGTGAGPVPLPGYDVEATQGWPDGAARPEQGHAEPQVDVARASFADTVADDPLAAYYDPQTIAAVDGWVDRHRRDPHGKGGPGATSRDRDARSPLRRLRGAGGAALLTAALAGVREVLDPEEDKPVVEEVVAGRGDEDAPVQVYFVPDAPKLTRVTCRPWLLEPWLAAMHQPPHDPT